VQVEKSTGINIVSGPAIEGINIVPNPTSGQANVIIDANTETTISVDLYDMTGRLVGNIYTGIMEVGKKSITFGTDNITSGVYLIKASDSRTILQKRFVKL
jgi:hypothetical protein